MELHPIWEKGRPLNAELWYVLSAIGENPTMRVGHTATYIPGGASSDGKVFFVGGANPDGQLADVYTLDLETFAWDTVDCQDFKARYEHIAFTPDSKPQKIFIVLGAEKTGNVSDVQVFDISTSNWEVVECNGTGPSARTHHTSAQLGDCIYVYSGGEHGSEPVRDRNVYRFDACTLTWTCLETLESPKPRHGHVLLAYDNKLILHGGMSGASFYDDLYVLDLLTKKWRSVKQRKIFPSARAAHGATVVGGAAYVFGGMGRDGALDDLYKLDLVKFKWQKMNLQGPAPTPRLDFAMTSIQARIPIAQAEASLVEQTKVALEEKLEHLHIDETRESNESERTMSNSTLTVFTTDGDTPPGVTVPNPTPTAERYGTVQVLLVHGGMDTDGEIWDDTLVFLVDNE